MSKKLFGLAASCLLALSTVNVIADEHEEHDVPQYAHVTLYRVAPAHSDEWEQLGKDWVKAFADAGADAKWNWYMSANGFEYVIVDMHQDMGSFDHGDEVQAEMAEMIGADTLAALSESAAGIDFEVVSSEVAKIREDLSFHGGEMSGPPGFIQVGIHYVKAGKGEQFEGAVKKVAEAWAQTETPGHWTTHEVTLGAGSYIIVSMAESAAAFYQAKTTGQVLTEAYGEDGAKELFETWRDSISNFKRENWFPQNELSYVAEMYGGPDAAGAEGGDS